MIMKKRLLILCLFIAENPLCLPPRRNWKWRYPEQGLAGAGRCSSADDTHLQLAAYFQECQGVGFSLLRPNDLMFFARFRDFAEIGEITFGFEERQSTGTWPEAHHQAPVFHPCFFPLCRHPTARCAWATPRSISRKGSSTAACPWATCSFSPANGNSGSGPRSEEERLTLHSLVRSETLAKEAQAGIFLFASPILVFWTACPQPEPAAGSIDGEARRLVRDFPEALGDAHPFFRRTVVFPFCRRFQCGPVPPQTGQIVFPLYLQRQQSLPTPAWCCSRRTSFT